MAFIQNSRKPANVRASVNPLDKATVVSILPKPICEKNATIQPGIFELKPGSIKAPTLLVVGPSSWWKEVSEDQPDIEIPVPATLIAASIVNDYSRGVLGCDMQDLRPGLFWVPGSISIAELRAKHSNEIAIAEKRQLNWFNKLVEMADILWVRSQGHPLSVSDDMKMAANELGIKDRDWLKLQQHREMKSCPACGVMNKPDIIVCPNCKVVLDRARFDAMKLQFAS